MAKPWAEVASSPQYQSLPPDQQDAARNQYFDQVVAPQVPADQLSAAKSQFDTSTSAPRIEPTPRATQPDRSDIAPVRSPPTLGDSVKDMLDDPMQASNALDKVINHPQEMSLAEKAIRLPETAARALIDNVDGMKRGAGLAARSVGEGFASLPLAITDLAGYAANKLGSGYHKLTGQKDWQYAPDSAQQTYRNGLTELGLPLPESNAEELGSAIGRGATSAAGGIGVGQLMREASSPLAAGIGDTLASAPGAQTVAGASGGASGEVARQAGASPEVQQVAAVAGGLAGGLSARNIDAPAPQAPLPAGSATTAEGAQTLRELSAQVEAKAQQGAEKIGLHWDDLDQNIKQQLMHNAEQATIVGSDLPPEALARKAVYESLGIKPTKALITRNFSDALNEQNLLTEPEGQALRNIYAENNQAIRARLQTLTPEGVNGVDQPTFGSHLRAPISQAERTDFLNRYGIEPEQFGSQKSGVVQNQIYGMAPENSTALDAPSFGAAFRSPIVEGERAAQKTANEAFRTAEAVEGGNQTSIQPVVNYLQENAPLLGSMERTKPVVAYLRQIGAISDKNMRPNSGVEIGANSLSTPDQLVDLMHGGVGYKALPISLKELSALREITNRAWKSAINAGDDSAAVPLNEIRGLINSAEENAGGELYKSYRIIRAEKGAAWENNPLIDKLISDQKGYRNTYGIEDSQVFDKAVLGSTPEQFSIVWDRLPGAMQNQTRAQVSRYLHDQVFSDVTNEGLSAANAASKLNGALDQVGTEKLNIIFGRSKVSAMREFIQTASKKSDLENSPLLKGLIGEKSGYAGTPIIQDSEVFDRAVLGSSTEEFGKLWPRLTAKAQDLTRAQLAKYIEDRTFSNMGMNERGDVVASAAKLNQTLDSINPQKLQLIYGKEKAVELERLNTAVREISSPPRGTMPQGSAPKLVYRMNILMKGLGLVTRIPFAGDIAKAIGSAAEKGAAAKANEAASEAAINPIPAAAPSSKSFGDKLEGFAHPAASLAAPSILAAPAQPGIIAPLLQDRNQ